MVEYSSYVYKGWMIQTLERQRCCLGLVTCCGKIHDPHGSTEGNRAVILKGRNVYSIGLSIGMDSKVRAYECLFGMRVQCELPGSHSQSVISCTSASLSHFECSSRPASSTKKERQEKVCPKSIFFDRNVAEDERTAKTCVLTRFNVSVDVLMVSL